MRSYRHINRQTPGEPSLSIGKLGANPTEECNETQGYQDAICMYIASE